ncbi:MAG: hypothetical protein COW13_03770 [Candidatus Omnitrophica bacterium CG12_big_fil_rev_8_21_14_0_65_50_5]|nr:MAG: hypothetical protein COW13_03770 [Candidatus Omnitrophica bacterium CG12_big_fil_rev_8_21_14_0_65_50_5]
MKKNLLLILLVVAVAVVSGCNTFRGAGKDVEAGGKGMQNIADKND